MLRIWLKRLAPVLLCSAAVHAWLMHSHRATLTAWCVEFGEHGLGGRVARLSGHLVWTEAGPFVGDDATANLCNALTRHGPSTLVALASWVTAVGVLAVAAGPLGRTRLFGYRGPTRCGTCGYALKGLTEPRCPECGESI